MLRLFLFQMVISVILVISCSSDDGSSDNADANNENDSEGNAPEQSSDSGTAVDDGRGDGISVDSSTASECFTGQRSCDGNLVRICQGGVWMDWNDCSVDGRICTVVEGMYQCVQSTGGDSGETTTPDSESATYGTADTDLVIPPDTDPDIAVPTDTHIDTETSVVTDDTAEEQDTWEMNIDTVTETVTETVADSGSHLTIDTDSHVIIDTGSQSPLDTGTGDVVGDFQVQAGGYWSAGEAHGYASSEAWPEGTVVNPLNFDNIDDSDTLCLSGEVVADIDWSGVAMLAMTLNEPADKSFVGNFVPTGEGVYVNISSPGGSRVRVQLSGPNWMTDEDDRWCADVSQWGGELIPWTSFNTRCWDGSGNVYNRAPLTRLMVIVPGHNSDNVPFHFCVHDVDISGMAQTDTDT